MIGCSLENLHLDFEYIYLASVAHLVNKPMKHFNKLGWQGVQVVCMQICAYTGVGFISKLLS